MTMTRRREYLNGTAVCVLLTLFSFSMLPIAATAQSFNLIYSFTHGPSAPKAALVQAPDGTLYGTTVGGGREDGGTVFTVNTNNALTVLVTFNDTNGLGPSAALTQGSDSNYYGTTEIGGSSLFGTVFKVTPDGTLTTLVNFGGSEGGSEGEFPDAKLIQGPDGNYYGTTSGGGTALNGTVFKMTPAGVLTVLHSFSSAAFSTNADGAYPYAALTLGADGNFYGTATKGGRYGNGTIFKITTGGVFTTLYSFSAEFYDANLSANTNADGANPYAALTLGTDGNFYGVTANGGSGGNGTAFKLTPGGSLSVLYSFSALIFGANTDGANPSAALTLGSDGNFYGVTENGGSSGNGTAFKLTPGGGFTLLALFGALDLNGDNANGANPSAALILGRDGSFYGTTLNGGTGGNGTVFKIMTNGGLTTLISLPAYTGSNGGYVGAYPYASLARGNQGTFYGTTGQGGIHGKGSVFKLDTSGKFTLLASFDGTNGATPHGALTLYHDFAFYYYGTTRDGGSDGLGTVFKVTREGALTTLASFNGTNGANPQAGLVVGNQGNFFGTTVSGGSSGNGTVFEITPGGGLTNLVNFDNFTNGENPEGGLLLASNGDFYGTTKYGGKDGGGTVFRMTPAGRLTTLATFNGTNGANPEATLMDGSDGNLYGTTRDGGVHDLGTVFKVTPVDTVISLASFDGNNGSHPEGALTRGTDGNFYGTTFDGGANGNGTVFKVTPNGAVTVVHSFSATSGSSLINTDGAYPQAGLTWYFDGDLYGITGYGGADGIGTVFQLTVPNSASPSLSIVTYQGRWVISWKDPTAAFNLQTAPEVTGPYTIVAGATSPYTNMMHLTQEFFRLKAK